MATTFIIEQGEREALTASRAEELLADLPEDASSVKLSGKSFGDGSAAVAGEKLARASGSLITLDLSDIIASRPEDEAKRALSTIAEALSDCRGLRSLDLSDNALGAKGVRAVSTLLEAQTELETIKFCNNGLAGDACALIADALVPAVETMREIHFHNNLSESEGAMALAPFIERCAGLEVFRFSSLRVGRKGCVRICQALEPSATRGLKRLNLSDNSFGPEGASALATTLGEASSLQVLEIRDCLLEDKGCVAALDAIKANGLREIDVSGNECAKGAAKALGRLVQKMKKLERVVAEDNEFGNGGAVEIAKGIDASNCLRVLNLNSCEIGGRGAMAVCEAAALCDTMESVLLDGNVISTPESELRVILGDRLGPLDENDEDGDDDDHDDENDDEDE